MKLWGPKTKNKAIITEPNICWTNVT